MLRVSILDGRGVDRDKELTEIEIWTDVPKGGAMPAERRKPERRFGVDLADILLSESASETIRV